MRLQRKEERNLRVWHQIYYLPLRNGWYTKLRIKSDNKKERKKKNEKKEVMFEITAVLGRH